ncbi:hypothetical protein ACCO45_000148 [Purpureocillium lilacinum]|uniref:Uncharacterized protein n=1 Tax=Purpureocillium lilacinum TaxID=33203 RepID=A0ACC4E4T5_PURLI
MSQDPLRLRVTVQRHGIPDVKFVWPCARAAADLSVAQLLAQINEVVPLEGGEWGLEDYAVELVGPAGEDGLGRGYECLHFQQVQQILKDEDQIVYVCSTRPLAALGSVPRGDWDTDQSAVCRIRSLLGEDLKRRRLSGRHQISEGGKHLVDGLAFGRPWLRTPRDRPSIELPPRKRQRAIEYNNEDEYDDSYEHPMLLLEAPELAEDDGTYAPALNNVITTANNRAEDDGSFADVDENTDEEIDDELELADGDMAEELELLRQDNAVVGEDPALATKIGHDPSDATSHEDAFAQEMGLLQAAFPLTSASAIGVELGRHDGNIMHAYEALKRSNDPALSLDKVLEMMLGDLMNVAVVESDDNDSADTDDTSSSDSSDSSGSDEADGGEGEEDGDSEQGNNSEEDSDSESESESESESGSGSDSDSGSDSGSDSDSSDDNTAMVGQVYPMFSTEPAAAAKKNTGVVQAESAPHTGLTKTQKRNARRRKLLAHRKSLDGSTGTPDSAPTELSLQERKEQLLKSLEQGSNANAEEHQGNQGEANDVAAERQGALQRDTAVAPLPRRRGRWTKTAVWRAGPQGTQVQGGRGENQAGTDERRPAAEQPRVAEARTGQDAAPAEDEDPDEWRKHISYSAVECCHEGVVLSEPPFPFRQRWDPQQQGRHWGKGKRKRQSQEFTEDYYDDSAVFYEDGDFAGGATRRSSGRGFKPFGPKAPAQDQSGASDKVNGAQPEAKKPEKADDVPPVPADLGSLPTLTAGVAKEGMVVTWKQMAMSKATRWQPEIVQLTGTVQASTDEAELHVLLAVRDREVRDRVYDSETGKRVYDKFEVPDSDGEDEAGEDDGQRVVPWDELMEPRILQDAPAPTTSATEGKKPLIQEVEMGDAEAVVQGEVAEGEVADDESSESESSDSSDSGEDEDEDDDEDENE